VSDPRVDVRSRLVTAARQIRLDSDIGVSAAPADADSFGMEPLAVLARNLRALHTNALSADQWSDDELDQFAERLALLVAGLRAAARASTGGRTYGGGGSCDQCEEDLERCQQPDPETGLPHLDCFMVYADCLLRCTDVKY
jgi:hypothetical protein